MGRKNRNAQVAAMTRCPRCSAGLDEGPVAYRCANCRRTVYAADLDTEYRTPSSQLAGAAT